MTADFVKGRYGKFVCEMYGNLNFVTRHGKRKKIETTAKRA
jgi:hypothetical protein